MLRATSRLPAGPSGSRGHSRPGRRLRRAVVVTAVWSALVVVAAPGSADADPGLRLSNAAHLAPGVRYETFSVTASHGTAHGHLLTVDLDDARMKIELLRPGTSGAVTGIRAPVSRLADARGAVAAVNGDFFDITEVEHPGVRPTGSTVGPAVADGRPLKAAVPDGQRYGPALVPGATDEDVLGIGADGAARLDRLRLRGAVVTPSGTWELAGFNQYALPVDGIGAYTSAWGPASRARASCGTNDVRAAACGTDPYEVTVHHGRVTSASATLGEGVVPRGSVVLVGREAGARALRRLRIGDPVHVRHRLRATGSVPLAFAIGGYPVLRGGVPHDGLDETAAATRTAAGFSGQGRRLYLLALDSGAEHDDGLTLGELARLLRALGADGAVDLDGGGSSTLVTRPPGAAYSTVRNHPSGVPERPVPNGIGVISSA
ncbi:phosphodiester glycosidase family protein [Streptomyces sp. SID13666]|nr:phosphodiester glycosidase family protein [Streptomyces sp. SID13666]NEA60364.1 phosphodiester glycosidase family protein [Streptomyces sp. SID13666]